MSAPDIWPFHARAFLGDTEKLTAAETGAYIRLLIFYWHNRGLPKEDDDICRITGLPDLAWKRSRAKLRALFGEGWRHERVERDRAFVAKQRAKQRANANRRWHPVHNEENFLSGQSFHGMSPPQQHQTHSNAATHAAAMPKEVKQFKLPSISSSPDAVNKWPSNKQARSKQHRAQQAWESDLRHTLNAEDYARAVELLAGDPELVERATKSEIRKPGSGVMAAMIGLSVREGSP